MSGAMIRIMEYTDFLPQLGDSDTLRKERWKTFQRAESMAKECVGNWPFGKLSHVLLTESEPSWCENGILTVTKSSLTTGALFHELFHPVLHNSPFKKKAESNNIDYRLHCESLCNAFQYYMETVMGVDGDWSSRIAKWRSMNWAQIIAVSGDLSWDMTYGLPALEFIRACPSFQDFKNMFSDLNAKS